ncbi:hypothetical protein FOXG_22454 [Fusarium oxysporum f. sp. lycopersici 4287]|uniref:Retrotransposon gag domain-containing protein n=1 Tax=Fusarium oxysporum f. sp. lycopersici (strain 4287 / CBS 123668 / FGSC 9935 / NRRL 34936) TaxID=426428 RepID=A0A0J9W878_FUSO4|nr:hypothetical protein FOXG_22454 [Fusarium oxysporum f. sp. lycopersici 4287]KNB19008.1 hypothetical protein FOXG_22454 [Fusarium oxysporum f. sp. lycopersici 4287]
MAPVTLSRPSTTGRSQHVTPPEEPRPLAEELQEVLIETDEEGDIKSPPIHLNSHEDEVKKLKKKLHNLGEQHNTLLDNAKNNAKIAQNRIEALEKKVADLAEIAESLGKTAENKPIIRDYINNPPDKRQPVTKYIYEKYKHFESELRNAFGIIDKKQMAEIKIRQLKQKGSAADYLAEYRYQAAKLN